MDLLVGKVTHYYEKIGVAILEVQNQPVKIGDQLKFSGHGQEFIQKVDSLQQEHKIINQADPGMVVGLKVNQKVKEKDQVFLVS